MKHRVLFLCATNSLSPMAEALLRHIDSRNFEVTSAGTSCEPIHPLTVEVMKEISIDLTSMTSKTVDTVREGAFDFAIILGEVPARETSRLNAIEIVHWKFENPVAVSENPDAQRRAFRSVRDQIAQRLRLFAIVNVRPSIPSERARLVASQRNPVVQTS